AEGFSGLAQSSWTVYKVCFNACPAFANAGYRLRGRRPRRRGGANGVRFLFYSHDSYGLGHVRRTIAVATRLIEDFRSPSALVLTGSPRAHYFRYPPRCDYVKLPSVTKARDGRYVPRELDLPLEQTVRLRGHLIFESVSSFCPRVAIADHA